MSKDQKCRAIIVDDEKYARADLRELLSEYPNIEVVAEAKNIKTAAEFIELFDPDLIFLDIQFTGESGFDLFEKANVRANVVFVTAYDEYALRAFEVNACDYLLKPINPERLALTIKRLTEKAEPFKSNTKAYEFDDSVYIQLNNRYHFIRLDTIVTITAAEHFTEVFTSNGIKGLSKKHLYEWSDCLPKNLFVQVHRSVIINVEFIENIQRGAYYSHHIKMKGVNGLVSISKKYLKQIKGRF